MRSLSLLEWKGNDYLCRWPENIFSGKQKKVLAWSLSSVNTTSDDNVAEGKSSEAALPDDGVCAVDVRIGWHLRAFDRA